MSGLYLNFFAFYFVLFCELNLVNTPRPFRMLDEIRQFQTSEVKVTCGPVDPDDVSFYFYVYLYILTIFFLTF